MAWLVRSNGVMALAWGGALLLALTNGCGSSSEKKAVRPVGDAGDAGASGETGSAGAEAAGAPSDAGSAGDSGAAGVAQGGRSGGGGGPGAGGDGSLCLADGNITELQVDPEPIYQVCRGAIAKVPFDLKDAPDTFTCCGTVSGADVSSYALTLPGFFNNDGGGHFEVPIPNDAPYGEQSARIVCTTQPNDQGFSFKVNDSSAPQILSVNAAVTPTSKMLIKGAHLFDVTAVGAIRADGRRFECVFKPEEKTSTEILCDFGGEITLSKNENDYYFIEVYADGCGYAPSPPPFLVVETLPN